MANPTTPISQCTWNSTGLNSASYTLLEGLFLLFCQTATPPTVDGVAMSLVGSSALSSGTTYLYSKLVSAGSHTIAGAGSSFFWHGISTDKADLLSFNTTNSKTCTLTPAGGNWIIGFICSSADGAGNYYTTPPSGFTELADVTSIGSGNDWQHTEESCYEIDPNSAISAVWTQGGNRWQTWLLEVGVKSSGEVATDYEYGVV